MFDQRLEEVKEHFRIQSPRDWCEIHPDEVRAIPGCGPVFVDYLRLHLANMGLTFKDDQTPLHWQKSLAAKRVNQISQTDDHVTADFTILIDTAEQQPFAFAGLRADANQENRPLVVPTRRQHLGVSRGDYSVAGMEGEVHVERKSAEDAISTVLGWGERREQFQRTLTFLAEIPSSCVMIECERDALLELCHSRGKKTKFENQKILNRQVMAWEDDYRVPWIFNKDRRRAEARTFLWLRRAWVHKQKAIKQSMKEL